MSTSAEFQKRIQSDVQTSTLLAGTTDSVGSRLQGFSARTGPSTVTGPASTVSSITLSSSALTLLSGTAQLIATALEAGGTVLPTVPDSWTSSDTGVATVSATGLVTVVAVGTCTIKATIGAVDSGDCTITVTAIFSALTLTPATRSFAHTTTSTTTVTAQDQFGADMTLPTGIAAASSDATKATVGIVTGTITITGVAAGTTNVTASKSGITSNACVCTLS